MSYPNAGLNALSISNGYDAFGRLNTFTDSTGRAESYGYDLAGNKTQRIVKQDAATNLTTSYTFDHFNRLVTVTSPKNEVTRYSYLPSGEIKEIKDPLLGVTAFAYDSLGQVISKTDPTGRSWAYTYDSNGNRVSETDPAGHLKTYVYNDLDQLVKKVLPDDVFEYGYDIRGRMTSVKNMETSVAFTVDALGRMTSSTSTGIGARTDLPYSKLDYTYNANNARLTTTDSFGGHTQYAYDSAGRPQSLVNARGEVFGFTFDSQERLAAITRPAVSTYFTYGSRNAIETISHAVGGNVISSYLYDRDLRGIVTAIQSSQGTESYGYDVNSFLTSASYSQSRFPASEGPDGESFAYDQLGNRTADRNGSYAYDSSAQSLLEDAFYRYTYDGNGNLRTKTTKLNGQYQKFDYTSENQLKAIRWYASELSATPLKEAVYTYDAVGRRVEKKVSDYAALSNVRKTFTRRYIYDSQEILAELDGGNNLLARYTHSNLKTDSPLSVYVTQSGVNQAVAASAGSYIYLADAIGTIKEITDSAGNILQRYQYSAFGQLLSIKSAAGVDITETPAVSTPFTFTGREFDPESELFYYRARYYDAKIGRFLQIDPAPGTLEQPISIINRSAYAANNPAAYLDPSGKIPFLAGLVIGAVINGLLNAAIDRAITGNWDNFADKFGSGFQSAILIGLVGYGVGAAVAWAEFGETAAFVFGGLAGGLVGAQQGYDSAPRGHELDGAVLGGLGGFFGGGFAALSGFNGFGALRAWWTSTAAPPLAPEAPIIAPGNYGEPAGPHDDSGAQIHYY